jgi:hypothetical protein
MDHLFDSLLTCENYLFTRKLNLIWSAVLLLCGSDSFVGAQETKKATSMEIQLGNQTQETTIPTHLLRLHSCKAASPGITVMDANTILASYMDASVRSWQKVDVGSKLNLSNATYTYRFVIDELRSSSRRTLLALTNVGESRAPITLLPQLFVRSNQMHLTVVRDKRATSDHPFPTGGPPEYALTVVRLSSQPQKEAISEEDVFFSSKWKGAGADWIDLEGVMPLDKEGKRLLFTGTFKDTHLSHGLLPLVPDPQHFTKSCAAIYEKGQMPLFKRIEEQGPFHVHRTDLCLDAAGSIHAAWIRRGYPKGDAVVYSVWDAGQAWSKPTFLTSAGRGWHLDVAVTTSDRKCYVLWAVDKDGFFTSSIESGKPTKTVRIGEWEGFDSALVEGLSMLDYAPCCSLTADNRGMLGAIWALNKRMERKYPNGRVDHRIIVKFMRDGQWKDSVVVSEGTGLVRAPNLVLDNFGNMHITYLKHIADKQFGYFYRKLKVTDSLDAGK